MCVYVCVCVSPLFKIFIYVSVPPPFVPTAEGGRVWSGGWREDGGEDGGMGGEEEGRGGGSEGGEEGGEEVGEIGFRLL